MPIIVPNDFQECPMEHLVSMTADMLERLLRHNDQIPLHPDALTRFHSRTAPSISVLDYLRRVVRYTNLERSCLLITLHYIDKMCSKMPRFTISSLTVHRFIIASVCVSTKALCDAFCTNSHYAKIGGIKVAELNVLEREFLSVLEWRLICPGEVLQEYYVNLARSHSSGAFEVED
ncbi:cyclin-domain-containing protein, partial [Clavulina sp. PMI_390]